MTQSPQDAIATQTAGATHKEESKEPRKRLRDYSFSIVALIIYIIYIVSSYHKEGFSYITDFTFQKYLFSLGAFTALIIGLNFGYMYPEEKRLWAITDLLWISMAIVALSGVLNPVENTILKAEVRTAANISELTRLLIAKDISVAVKSMCASQSTFQECKDWKIFAKNVDAARIDPLTLYGRAKVLWLPKLPLSPPSKVYLDAIEKKLKSLENSIDREQRAQSRLDDVNIAWAYIRVFLLMIALGLRAGKTGAELRKNPPKTSWKQQIDKVLKFRPFKPR